MKNLIALILLTFTINGFTQTAIDNTFTYQGELSFNNAPANGDFDFKFVAYDTQDDGTGNILSTFTIDSPPITVTNGIFTAPINFPDDVFLGDKVWLEINVQIATDTNNFQKLTPRQSVNSTPYAIHAQFVGTIGTDAVTGAEIVNQSITNSDLATNSVNASNIINNSIGTSEIAADAVTDVELANNAVDTAAIQNSAITANKIGSSAVGTDEIISSQVQRRINSSCNDGFYLSGINEDGSVQCKQLFGIETIVDGSSFTGYKASVAIRPASGLPIISYTADSYPQFDLRVYACSNPSCSEGTSFVLVSNTGDSTSSNIIPTSSLAVRTATGFPIIGYYDANGKNLMVYDCSNSNCSSGTKRVLESYQDVGSYLSLAVGQDGLPVVSYYNATTGNLKFLRCTNQDCTTRTSHRLDNSANVGTHTSIAIRPTDGKPVISYKDETNNSLKYFQCDDSNCGTGTAITLDNSTNVGSYSSIAVSNSGYPMISYFDSNSSDLKLYKCSTRNCSSGNISTLDSGGVVGLYTSIAFNPATSLPIISYYDASNSDLKVYDCIQKSCLEGESRTLISNGFTGFHSSLAIGVSGLPVIAYQRDGLVSGLSVFSCADSHCIR